MKTNWLGQQGTSNRIGLACDHRQERPCRPTWNSPSVLPVFQGALTQAEKFGEFALSKRDGFADRAYVNFRGDMDLATVVLLTLSEHFEATNERRSFASSHATRNSACPRFLAVTTMSTSCPSATRKRISRSTE